MGKVTKFTGSKVLGAELRRLRGGRSLKQIAELSRTPPLSDRIAAVAAPTLSQIENGISFPSLETLHALAVMYQTSVQQLLDLVVQERWASDVVRPETEAACREAFLLAFRDCHWHEALALAVHGERLATEAPVRVSWRGNRALCMARVGLRHDAIQVLLECCDSPELRPGRRYQLEQSLADVLAASGHLSSAALHLRAALESFPDDAKPETHRRLLTSRAQLVLMRAKHGQAVEERELREIQRQLVEAEQLTPPTPATPLLLNHVLQAQALEVLGNRTLARTRLLAVLKKAEDAKSAAALTWTRLSLGLLERDALAPAKARRHLEAAALLAMEVPEYSTAFDAHFELYRLWVEEDEATAARHLKRCERLHPVLEARTPNVLSFERLARGLG